MKFTNVKQIQEEFMSRSNGSFVKHYEDVRFEDIERHGETLQAVLEGSDYNKLQGFGFGDVMSMVANLNSSTPESYLRNFSAQPGNSIQEAFGSTTQAMSPTPIVNQGLTMYKYVNTVLPYIANIFDMKGSDRAYAYYYKFVADKTIGDVTAGDLLASPKELGKQTKNYVSTRVTEIVGATAIGDTTYTIALPFAPVQPQTLVITIDSLDGSLQDVTTGTTDGIAYLLSVGGNLGTATVNLNTGTVDLVLATTPTGVSNIRATFLRDTETAEADTTNLARITPVLETVNLRAEYFSVKAKATIHQEALYKSIFGRNWNEDLDDMLGSLYNREIANKAVADLKGQIGSGSIFTHDLTSATNTGDNRLFNAKFIEYPLNKLNSLITKASGNHVSRATTQIVNQDFLPILRGHDKFVEIDEISEETMGGMALVGTVNKTPVIATPDNTILTAGEVIALHKSKRQSFLCPIVVGNYIEPTIRQVFDTNNLAINNKQLFAGNAVQTVAPALASKAVFTGIDTILG